MIDNWLFFYVLLLDSDRDLLLNLGLNHFKKEFLVLGVHSTSTLAPSARVRATFLCLPAIAAEARNGLHGLLLLELEN